jgi:hypothetical protein
MPDTDSASATAAVERLRDALEAIHGVQRVFVAGEPPELYVLCQPGSSSIPLEAAVNIAMAREGISHEETPVHLAFLGAAAAQRRVRFREALLTRPRAGVAAVRVALEWNDEVYEGAVEGEGGLPLELRVCARATLRALEAVLADRMRFELLGVKSVRIFDHDYVSVLLRCPDAPERPLIGVSLSSADLPAATARAVLNATNRLLGNFLMTGE